MPKYRKKPVVDGRAIGLKKEQPSSPWRCQKCGHVYSLYDHLTARRDSYRCDQPDCGGDVEAVNDTQRGCTVKCPDCNIFYIKPLTCGVCGKKLKVADGRVRGRNRMKYRRRPLVDEAIQWDGNNKKEIERFLEIITVRCQDKGGPVLMARFGKSTYCIHLDDWVVKFGGSAFGVRKPDIFEQTYEAVE